MIAPLRRRHRFVWHLLAVLLLALFVSAVALRQRPPGLNPTFPETSTP